MERLTRCKISLVFRPKSFSSAFSIIDVIERKINILFERRYFAFPIPFIIILLFFFCSSSSSPCSLQIMFMHSTAAVLKHWTQNCMPFPIFCSFFITRHLHSHYQCRGKSNRIRGTAIESDAHCTLKLQWYIGRWWVKSKKDEIGNGEMTNIAATTTQRWGRRRKKRTPTISASLRSIERGWRKASRKNARDRDRDWDWDERNESKKVKRNINIQMLKISKIATELNIPVNEIIMAF